MQGADKMTWDFRSDRPIYAQIVEQMILFVASGELKPGEKVSPVRELASDAGVNPNTMQRALANLEQIGLMITNRTTGRFVTDDIERIDQIRRSIADEYSEDFLRGMSKLGYTRREAVEIINNYKGKGE